MTEKHNKKSHDSLHEPQNTHHPCLARRNPPSAVPSTLIIVNMQKEGLDFQAIMRIFAGI